ncbi:MAG: hypothetical protein HKN03_11345 [Acidimicrobiales bacterium]|nr:hypothetical protein [Acidimicrobiales bacterium]
MVTVKPGRSLSGRGEESASRASPAWGGGSIGAELGRLERVFKGVKILLVVMVLAGCSSAPSERTAEARPATVVDLMDQGYSAEVSSCVVGLADGEPEGPAQTELIESCERASDMLNTSDEPPEELPFDQPSTYGDDAALDLLWDECEQGSGQACDKLWSNAPLGSEYEEFGVSCGARPEILNCSELVRDQTRPE